MESFSYDTRDDARAYEGYIGRWSRVVAREFVAWLALPPRAAWCDVACGTGVLAGVALAASEPARVDCSDLEESWIAYARGAVADPRVRFAVGDATTIDAPDGTYDAVVTGLGFPPIRETAKALAEFRRVAKPGGIVAAYVWDFDGEMQLLRSFWDAAASFESDAEDEEDVERFALCRPERLAAAWTAAGFAGVETRAIDAAARFVNFDDYWTPFLTGSSPAQEHVRSLDDARRDALRERLRATLPTAADGSIVLLTRAWAVKGVV